jgi:hypothetical protein
MRTRRGSFGTKTWLVWAKQEYRIWWRFAWTTVDPRDEMFCFGYDGKNRPTNQRSTRSSSRNCGGSGVRFARLRPTLMEALKMIPTGRMPPSL